MNGSTFLNSGDNHNFRRYIPSGFTSLNYLNKVLCVSLESRDNFFLEVMHCSMNTHRILYLFHLKHQFTAGPKLKLQISFCSF